MSTDNQSICGVSLFVFKEFIFIAVLTTCIHFKYRKIQYDNNIKKLIFIIIKYRNIYNISVYRYTEI